MGDAILRLAVHGAFTLPDLAADPAIASVEPDEAADLWASYWDTADLRLARQGVTLRHRSVGRTDSVWSLQLPDGWAAERAGAVTAPMGREVEFAGGAERVPAGAADLVSAYARTAPLAEIAALTTRRRRWSLLDERGSVAATLTDDEVSVVDGGHPVSRFREIELESRQLAPDAIARIGELLRSSGAVDAEPISLVIRALGPAATAPADAVAPSIDADASAGAVLRAALTDAVNRFVRSDAGVRLGDPEALHQARVGLRTLRSHLRVFAPLLGRRWTISVETEIRPLARALGKVRDLDVLAARVRDHGGDLAALLDPLVDDIARRREGAQAELLARMRDEGYASLLERLVAAAAAPRLAARAGGPAREVLPPLFRAAWRRVRRRADALGPRSPAASYHAVRIRVKRARYAATAIAAGLDADAQADAERFARRASVLQAMLGSSQDAAMARTEIMAAAARRLSDGPFNLAAGVLLEREARSGDESQRAFREAWPRARRRRHRAWARR